MPKRHRYDLSHMSFMVGDIGGLQTLSCIYVVAGDSIGVNLEGIFRLAPLRRQLVADAQIDIFGFWVPMRHIYGDQWIDFIKDGMSESETFAGVTATGASLSYLGSEIDENEVFPLWRCAAYNRIWNYYMRSPTDALSKADTFITILGQEHRTGLRMGPLPVAWSTGVTAGVGAAERDVAVTGGGTVFDIVDLERIQAQYASEVDRKYFGVRYKDILKSEFGGRAGTDADERPTLCGHQKIWMSGYDIDGTGDANLGAYSGKALSQVRFNMPRKYFGEHGSLWIMASVRLPTVHVDERPEMHMNVNPTFLEASGDARLIAAEPPKVYNQEDFFRGGGAVPIGTLPFGQHYRYQPSVVHRNFREVDGFTFLDSSIDTIEKANYLQSADYDEMFDTNQLRHWNASCRLDVDAFRIVPPAASSLYAGV